MQKLKFTGVWNPPYPEEHQKKVLDKKLKWNTITDKQFNELFGQAIESHKKTKEAIKNCNFNNTAPKQNNDDCAKECDEGKKSPIYPHIKYSESCEPTDCTGPSY